MALTEDQRAMLQLLLERDQSYSDIGSLLGLETGEVRARARAALSEMGGEDPDRDVGLTDYLLGQADPIGRADAVRHLGADEDAHALAAKLIAQLRLIAPAAQLPELPERRGRQALRPKSDEDVATGPAAPPVEAEAGATGAGVLASLSARQRQLIAALLGGGVLVIAVVLIATGTFGGDDDSNGGGGGQAEQTNQESVTRAVLVPRGGGDARGVATFGRVRNVPVLDIAVSGLEPSPRGQTYVIWLYRNRQAAFPVSAERVGRNGRMRGQAPLSNEALSLIQQGTFDSVDISLTSTKDVSSALQQAQRELRDLVTSLDRNPDLTQEEAADLLRNADTDILPDHSGSSVLRGPIEGPALSAPSRPQG
jgi:hypothetical protein